MLTSLNGHRTKCHYTSPSRINDHSSTSVVKKRALADGINAMILSGVYQQNRRDLGQQICHRMV